ncbi:potassium transporter Trk [Microbacterium sp.]|uniref:potassium transporter Trk n=1 Tax=Microbacterium sp. TaxID=51671 RepID=UPI0028125C3D|nr:potassium transporter Trk [Microbacterium sp.]
MSTHPPFPAEGGVPADQLVSEQVSVRRSPRYGVFAAVGAALGIVVAMILATAFDGTSEPSPFTEVVYSPSQAFGFILLWCVPAGILLAMVAALLLEWTIGRRTRRVTVLHETVADTE